MLPWSLIRCNYNYLKEVINCLVITKGLYYIVHSSISSKVKTTTDENIFTYNST